MRRPILGRSAILGLTAILACATAVPALAQSTGYVTGFPGRDPADDDAIGWGPAYRPETSFSQPGTPPTPGDIAGAAYRARTGHGPYDAIQGSGLRGARSAPEAEAYAPPRPRRHAGQHRRAKIRHTRR